MNFTIKKSVSIQRILVLVFMLAQSIIIMAQGHSSNMKQEGLYEVTSIGLNIRNNPQKSSVILGTLKEGEKVWIYRFNGKWGETDYGWVSGKYLKKVLSSASDKDNLVGDQTPASAVTYNAQSNMPNSKIDDKIYSNFDRELFAFFIIIAAIYVIMLMVGMSGKVVVYYDEADLVISLMPWLIILVAAILAFVYQPTENSIDPQKILQTQQIILGSGFVLTVIFALWSMVLSIKYNRSFMIGFPYGIFKLASGLIGILVLIGQIATMKNEKTNRNQFFFAVMVFGGFVWLGKKLINGKRVYRDKGWKLPE